MAKEKKEKDVNEQQEQETKEETKAPKEKTTKAKQKAADAQELEALRTQLAEKEDMYLRLAAEYSNFRSRSQREKEALAGDTKATVISQLLPVLDNFERAAQNAQADLETYKKGVEMIFNQFTDILTKLGVEPFGEEGDSFDPKLHSAVMHTENEELPENSVSRIFTKGYKLGDRTVRCAIVEVAN